MKPPLRKIGALVLAFLISVSVFLMLRVAGVIYLGDLFEDVVSFDPMSALHLMTWVGLVVSIALSSLVISLTVDMDRIKLIADVSSAALLAVGLWMIISYNYVGYTYPELFDGMEIFERLFLRLSYWSTIFSFYGLPDVFYAWMITTGVFYGMLSLFVITDFSEFGFMKIFGFRTKRRDTTNKTSFATVYLLNVIPTMIIVFAINRFVEGFSYDTNIEFSIITSFVVPIATSLMIYFVVSIKKGGPIPAGMYILMSSVYLSFIYVFIINGAFAYVVLVAVCQSIVVYGMISKVVFKH